MIILNPRLFVVENWEEGIIFSAKRKLSVAANFKKSS